MNRKQQRASRQHGRFTSPKSAPTRREGRRGKFPSTYARSARRAAFQTHGTSRILNPGARRRANKASWAKELRQGRIQARAYRAIAKEMGA